MSLMMLHLSLGVWISTCHVSHDMFHLKYDTNHISSVTNHRIICRVKLVTHHTTFFTWSATYHLAEFIGHTKRKKFLQLYDKFHTASKLHRKKNYPNKILKYWSSEKNINIKKGENSKQIRTIISKTVYYFSLLSEPGLTQPAYKMKIVHTLQQLPFPIPPYREYN